MRGVLTVEGDRVKSRRKRRKFRRFEEEKVKVKGYKEETAFVSITSNFN